MDIKDFLNAVCKQIKCEYVKQPISQELEQHIQDLKESYIDKGMNEVDAEEIAIKQMGEPEEIGKRLNKVHKPKLDWKLLILILILVIYGIFIAICKQNSSNSILRDKIFHIVLGIIIGLVIYFYDYRKIKRFSNIIYIIAVLIILLPAFNIFGATINGLKYFYIPGLTLNSAVVTLPLFIVSFVGFITNYDQNNKMYVNIKVLEKKLIINKDLIKILTFSIFSLMLLMEIPSIASVIILGISYLVITTLYVIKTNKNSKKILIKIYGTLAIFMILFISAIGVNSFRINRIVAAFKPELDPNGSGYIGMLQKEVMQNAKMIGESDTEIMSRQDDIISTESNFTFIYLIGKTGILISSILVITIILTSIKLLINSRFIKDFYGKYIIIGLSILYILQSIMSILMNINLGVQLNIDLPFVSTGGVYFIINAVSIALILSIYRRKNINMNIGDIAQNPES